MGKLKTNLKFRFEEQEEFSDMTLYLGTPVKTKQINSNIKIISNKPKRNVRDSSINTKLF
jgi:hypothetical protein